MKRDIVLISVILTLASASTVRAQVPQLINYQGRIVTAGTNFNGTGQFKFALVNDTGLISFWSNDGTSVAGGQPTTSVSLTVVNGLYSVLLGDTALPNMTAVPAAVFANTDVRLRVWFNDGVTGFQLLVPDQRIASVGYAMMSANVQDGAITTAKLADNAVTSAKLANGAVATADLAAGSVTAGILADGSVTTPKLADAAVTLAKLANDSVNSTKVANGGLLGEDLANGTVTSLQLADFIELGAAAPASNGELHLFRTPAGTAGISLLGSSGNISTYGSDGLIQTRLYGSAWGQLLLYDNTGNDNTVALNANSDGGGSLVLYHSNNADRVQISASSVAGELRLYGTNDLLRTQLHGGTDGSYLNLYAGDGTSGLYLDGDDGGGGSIGVRNTNGSNRVYIDGQGNSGGGQINVYTGDGQTGAILYGDVSGGAQMYLYNTNGGLRLWLDGYGTDGGGEVSVYANDGSKTVSLYGESGLGDGGGVAVNNGSAREVAHLYGTTYGGRLQTYDENGDDTVLIGSSTSAGGFAYFYQGDGQIGLNIDGDNNGAGYMVVNGTNGTAVITINGNSSGNGRITTQELQITGGSDLSEQFDIKAIRDELQAGMVVCIDPSNPGQLVTSSRAYDRTVAGVVSGAGGVKPGMLMGQSGTKADGQHPVALSGRVYCLADASSGAIQPGDLLTTSDTPGHAMKVTDHQKAQGAVIGKAMTALADGQGLVLVLVSLQ